MINFLVIEDNLADYRLVQEAMKDIDQGELIRFTNISDGNSAIDYVYNRGKYYNMAIPDLIMLDLNVPRRTGIEILNEIKDNDKWCHIPVIIFSSSSSPVDIERSYHSGASAYVVKPGTIDDFFGAIHSVHSFWIEHVAYHKNQN